MQYLISNSKLHENMYSICLPVEVYIISH